MSTFNTSSSCAIFASPQQLYNPWLVHPSSLLGYEKKKKDGEEEKGKRKRKKEEERERKTERKRERQKRKEKEEKGKKKKKETEKKTRKKKEKKERKRKEKEEEREKRHWFVGSLVLSAVFRGRQQASSRKTTLLTRICRRRSLLIPTKAQNV